MCSFGKSVKKYAIFDRGQPGIIGACDNTRSQRLQLPRTSALMLGTMDTVPGSLFEPICLPDWLQLFQKIA
jgi:hypothetical protein